jgi:hypothetical protein
MKKKFLLIVTWSFVVITAFSQEAVIKPTLGVNFTNFSKDPSTGEYKSQLGWQIGGSVSFGKKFYVEPGVFYAKKSTDYVNSNSGADSTIRYSLGGVRIPLAVGYSIIGGGNIKAPVGLRVFAGGSAFILTNVSEGNKSDYKSTAWGVFAGAGLDIGIFFLDLKYEWSLTNIQNDISMVDIGQTRTIYINLGFRIPISM